MHNAQNWGGGTAVVRSGAMLTSVRAEVIKGNVPQAFSYGKKLGLEIVDLAKSIGVGSAREHQWGFCECSLVRALTLAIIIFNHQLSRL